MPRHCPVCTHSQRTAIDEALQAGERMGALADAYGISVRQIRAHTRCTRPQPALTPPAAAHPGPAKPLGALQGPYSALGPIRPRPQRLPRRRPLAGYGQPRVCPGGLRLAEDAASSELRSP